jgi:hypothetical protein
MSETIIDCNEFQSIGIGCKDNIGGLKNFWIASFENFSFTIDAATTTGHTVTAITTGITALYEITPARASAFATEVQAVDNTNTIWQQDIALLYSKNQATLESSVPSVENIIGHRTLIRKLVANPPQKAAQTTLS